MSPMVVLAPLRLGGRLMAGSPPDTTPEACGDDDIGICEWVYESTDGNRALAKASDWLLGKPLAIAIVLLAAWLLRIVARWLIRRGVRRVVVPPSAVARLPVLGAKPVDEMTDRIDQARRVSRAESIGSSLAGVATVVIWVSALVSIARIIGFDVAPLLAGAGVLGVALGFGAQSLVRDCISGLFMLIEDQYGLGDSVDLGSAVGTVERVSLRTTVLRGMDGTVWHVPNGEIRRVGNQSQLWSMAIVDLEVAVTVDIDEVRELLVRTARDVCARDEWNEAVLEPPRVPAVESVTADGVTFRLAVKTLPGRQWALQRALREDIKYALDAAGIPLPAKP